MIAWQRFVLEHGFRAQAAELAHVLGVPRTDIEALRGCRACRRLGHAKRFAELFTLWHGRAPSDREWPAPRKAGMGGTYEWQPPELAFLATLVGRLAVRDIAAVLTERLRKFTGDARALRKPLSVQLAMNRIGLVSTDVMGGITTREAGREIGSLAIINQAIDRAKQNPKSNFALHGFRVGRLWVIPRDEWERWKSQRVFPPKGCVQLARLKGPLAIRSDKLSEFARMGYIPTAVRCNPYGSKVRSTKYGSWFIDAKVARKLVADRRAGRAMPWHGQVIPENLRATYTLWKARKHPAECATCAQIWGRAGAPASFADYEKRYPPLEHGAKRHLTRVWHEGLSPAEVARLTKRAPARVQRAIANGVLTATRRGRRLYVTRTDATRWKARHCPTGDSDKSWISLSTARAHYHFTFHELRASIANGTLKSTIGTNGPMRGIVYVPRQQCAELRERLGYSEGQAARRAGVSIARLRTLLRGVNWRGTGAIPRDTVNAVIKRLQSQEGYTIAAAAKALRVSEKWIRDQIIQGTVRVARAKWDRRRLYLSEPMFQRLKYAKHHPVKRERFGADWLLLSDAALEAEVTSTQIIRWAEHGELRRRRSRVGWRYHRKAVRSRARAYWQTIRYRRAQPPQWLIEEQRAAA